MAVSHLISRHIGIPEAGLALIVAAGLAVPFALPGERPTRIAVRFQTADMPRPGSFIVHTSANICHVLSSLLSYKDPTTGEFVQINCGRKAEALAQQIHAERAADPATIPVAATDPQ
jgi:hypothetical protein